jgi:hypothetical protein
MSLDISSVAQSKRENERQERRGDEGSAADSCLCDDGRQWADDGEWMRLKAKRRRESGGERERGRSLDLGAERERERSCVCKRERERERERRQQKAFLK